MMIALTRKWLIVLLSSGLLLAGADKDEKFDPGAVTDYPSRQTVDQVTIAASPFLNDEETGRAFGKKLNPNKHGVLPVLVIIRNERDQTVALTGLRVQLISGRQNIEATPPQDVRYLKGAGRPKVYQGPIPGTGRVSREKNPLNSWTIEGRAFAAKMLPPKETASGFFYFRAPFQEGAKLYVTGLKEAGSGKELFYFEIPLETK